VSAEEAESAFPELLDMTRAERRVGRPEDVADVVLLVVQEKARWITGQYISASGGITGL
jgi:NAD(P)-dependent dehydrogenase (short-subunit alcohol dehydrogenase family)